MMVSDLISIYNEKLEQTTNTLNEIRAKVERNEQAAEALEARAKKKRATAEKLRQSMKKVETVGWSRSLKSSPAGWGKKHVFMGRTVSV